MDTAGLTVSTTDVGNVAEQAVAEELARQGFTVLQRNWRTKYCEVDIIARKDDVIWFIEVKYRQNEKFGDGLAYIGPGKLMHMQRAASLWTAQRRYHGEYTLGAVAVTGNYRIGELVEI
ncbi:MAG TPA: YraN family protein [Candidatus Saccharimonadales bacterium]|nr:YraN family protein [Candidatus Saccharimonadales bacterium]